MNLKNLFVKPWPTGRQRIRRIFPDKRLSNIFKLCRLSSSDNDVFYVFDVSNDFDVNWWTDVWNDGWGGSTLSDVSVAVRRSTLSDVYVAVWRSRRNQEEAAFVGVGSNRFVVLSETKKWFSPRFKISPLFDIHVMFKLNPLVEINFVFKLIPYLKLI